MKRTRNKLRLFRELSIVDEMQKALIDNSNSEKLKQYKKMQNLFFKHCNYEINRK